jgi:hypothetical protein
MTIDKDKECETCFTLHNEISSLKLQLEEASKSPKEFAIQLCKIRHNPKNLSIIVKVRVIFPFPKSQNTNALCHLLYNGDVVSYVEQLISPQVSY